MSGRWVEVNYPGRQFLSESEAMNELRRGPEPAWFRPWAEHLGSRPRSSRSWGYVHLYGDSFTGVPVWELVGYWSLDALAWGLHNLFTRGHDWYLFDLDGDFNDHECGGVWYWLPGDPQIFPMPLGVNR
jgi:hypothetical protein